MSHSAISPTVMEGEGSSGWTHSPLEILKNWHATYTSTLSVTGLCKGLLFFSSPLDSLPQQHVV